ncbi:MAG: hypothetical protein KAJ24_03685 [Candidatus Aenigmarchaeota archaeon]|nr:hypothetical protein [Candidatus Aenigmarchaeota archaeon]
MAKKGLVMGNIMVIIVGLLISVFMLVMISGEFIWSAQKDVETIARQTAKSFASEVSAISAVGQGVRFFETSESFIISLKEKEVLVTYGSGDEAYLFVYPHTAANVDPAVVGEVKTICISKKLVGCIPHVTICEKGDPCCFISPGECAFAG